MSSLVSSLIRLSLASVTFAPSPPLPSVPPSRTTTPARLLGRLHRALHAARHHCHWAVADWGLQRARKVAAQLRQVGATDNGENSYEEVIRALELTDEGEWGPSPVARGVGTPGVQVGGRGEGFGAGGGVGVSLGDSAGTGLGMGSGGVETGAGQELPQMADLDAWLNVLDGTPVWGDFEADFGMGEGGPGAGLAMGPDGFQWGW